MEATLDDVCSKIDSSYTIFPKPFKEQNDFLVDDANEMIEEAYLAEDGGKWLIVKALQYRLEAQNRLLKLIEEPPSGVKFIFLVKNRSFLLPTIRSRLPITNSGGKKEQITWQHPNSSSDLAMLLKECENWDKNVAKDKLCAFLEHASKISSQNLNLSNFDKAFELLSLNSRPSIVFAWLLSMKI